MFARADQMLIEQSEDSFPLHVIEFYWKGFEPGVVLHDVRDDRISELVMDPVSFSVSKKRTCIGYFDDHGGYVRCAKSSPVSRFAQCADCSKEVFLPVQECVFEPRCNGEICDLDFCRREHVLYLAFYDTKVKVGMSSSRRIERRLIEQGADAFAVIAKRPTRLQARNLEKEITTKLGIPQWVKKESVLRNLASKVDVRGIEGRYIGLQATLEEKLGDMSPERLKWLDGYPIKLPLEHVPRLQDSWGVHKGEYVGIKGRYLVYRSDGLRALDLADLPSRYLLLR
jgi:hypothetical protein